ncbi:hypothetical protein AGR1C_pAt20090 [Agrobacterium fabacearum TT111]|nr:hypothetical protein AGR1C_pAt20090 [Agrobacterium fabacearum TT111]
MTFFAKSTPIIVSFISRSLRVVALRRSFWHIAVPFGEGGNYPISNAARNGLIPSLSLSGLSCRPRARRLISGDRI